MNTILKYSPPYRISGKLERGQKQGNNSLNPDPILQLIHQHIDLSQDVYIIDKPIVYDLAGKSINQLIVNSNINEVADTLTYFSEIYQSLANDAHYFCFGQQKQHDQPGTSHLNPAQAPILKVFQSFLISRLRTLGELIRSTTKHPAINPDSIALIRRNVLQAGFTIVAHVVHNQEYIFILQKKTKIVSKASYTVTKIEENPYTVPETFVRKSKSVNNN